MKVQIKTDTVDTYYAGSHTQLIISLSYQHRKISCAQFLEYIRLYKPQLEMTYDSSFEYRTGNWLSRVVCNRFFFSQFNSAEVLRILEYVMANYTVDVNAPDRFGSPLILYAIQSGFIDVVNYLVSKGARFTENGVCVRNKVYTDQNITVRYCLTYVDKAFQQSIHELVFNEVVPK